VVRQEFEEKMKLSCGCEDKCFGHSSYPMTKGNLQQSKLPHWVLNASRDHKYAAVAPTCYGEKPFDLDDWKRRIQYNRDEFERNSLMDSGWSATVHDNCLRVSAYLWRELAVAMAATQTEPQDFFDRPDLVAVQEAARWATKP
jgi:hypothetical protein